MRNIIRKMSVVVAVLMAVLMLNNTAFAEEENTSEEDELIKAATSVSISPVSKVLQLQPNTIYEDSFKVTNNGSEDMNFEVYASPYSYTYSEETDDYQLGFSKENNYTQITRWITFKGTDGIYAENPKFVAKPGESVEIDYRIATPESLPAGGQYAVLFAHTISSATTSGGIRAEASPGLVIYGRAVGETVTKAEVNGLKINQTMETDDGVKNIINASGKVKNTGNVDFTASGELIVEGVFGRTYYRTPKDQARTSVIPETELSVSDKWEDTPYLGLFKATWKITAAGEEQTITQMILILPIPIIVVMILLLTIIIIWIIIVVRKRKERRSRFKI